MAEKVDPNGHCKVDECDGRPFIVMRLKQPGVPDRTGLLCEMHARGFSGEMLGLDHPLESDIDTRKELVVTLGEETP